MIFLPFGSLNVTDLWKRDPFNRALDPNAQQNTVRYLNQQTLSTILFCPSSLNNLDSSHKSPERDVSSTRRLGSIALPL